MPASDSAIVALRRARLRSWIHDTQDGTQAAFVMATGIDQDELAGLLNGGRPFGERRARSLENTAGMVAGYLDNPDASNEVPASPFNVSEPGAGYLRLALAGDGVHGVGPDNPAATAPVIRSVDIAEWEVSRKLGFVPDPGRIQLFIARGPSMRPKIDDGDTVWVDTACDHFDGDDYYLIRHAGHAQIKLLQERGDGLYVVSANPEFKDWRCGPDDIVVEGKALALISVRHL